MTPPVDSRAQTAFFSVGFANLHQLVLEQLAEVDSRHPVLPLLHVSRYWRIITTDFLLEPYQATKLDTLEPEPDSDSDDDDDDGTLLPRLTPGAFVKFSLTAFCNGNGPVERDDPRYYFSDKGLDMPSVILLLQSCDPSTLICTFAPPSSAEDEVSPHAAMMLTIACSLSTRKPYVDVIPSFALVPSTWFVREKTAGSGLWGHDVAFKPGSFPSPYPFIFGPTPEEPGACEVVPPEEKKGWSVDYEVLRLDGADSKVQDHDDRWGPFDAPAILIMRSAKIPLAGLYRPTELTDYPAHY